MIYTWSVPSGGTIDATTGLFVAGTTKGVYKDSILAKATRDGITKTGYASVTVTPGDLHHITVTPGTKTLKAVSDRVAKEKLTNIETVLSDPTDTKLADESVDSVVIVNVLHHVPKDKRAPLVKDIVESIRPGGYLFIVDWRLKAKIKHDIGRRIPRDDLVKLATDTGLKLDAEFHYLVHQVFLRFRKAGK